MANKGIEALEAFYASLNLPKTLKEVGITSDEHFEQMAQSVMDHWLMSEAIRPLTLDDVLNILKGCL